jgi:hypothetical protein
MIFLANPRQLLSGNKKQLIELITYIFSNPKVELNKVHQVNKIQSIGRRKYVYKKFLA